MKPKTTKLSELQSKLQQVVTAQERICDAWRAVNAVSPAMAQDLESIWGELQNKRSTMAQLILDETMKSQQQQ